MGEKGSSDKLVREGRWGEGEDKHRQVIQTNFNKLLVVCWHFKKRTSFFSQTFRILDRYCYSKL